MPAVIANSAEGLTRTSGLVAASSDYTWAGWVYVDGTPAAGTYRTFLYHGNDPATYTQYVWVGQHGAGDANAGKLELAVSLTTSVFGSVLSAGWHFITYTRTGSTHRVYRNATLSVSKTKDISGETHTHAFLGTDTYADDWDPVKIGFSREWDAALSASEIQQQWIQPVRVKPADLWSDTPLASNRNDISGSARHWSESGGTITFGTPPSNVTLAAATALTLPATESQDDAAEAAFDWVYPLWFKYTAQAGDVVLGHWGRGDDFNNFSVRAWVYKGADLAQVLIPSANRRQQVGLVAGQTYYIVLAALTPATVPADATMLLDAELHAATSVTAPYFINNAFEDSDYPDLALPAAFMSGDEDNEIVRFLYPFATGEGGDRLADGTMLFSDIPAGNLRRVNSSFVEVGTIAFDIGIGPGIRAHHPTDTFWVGDQSSPPVAKNYSAAGAELSSVTLAGTSLDGIAVNSDSTILYQGWVTGNPIRRYSLPSGTLLSNLAAGVAQYRNGYDIIVLPDDTLLVSYCGTAAVSGNWFVRRYDSDGTLLRTYEFGEAFFQPARIAFNPDVPTAFWAYWEIERGRSRIRKVHIETGVTMHERTYVMYQGGVYKPGTTETPLANFGHDTSCPLIVIADVDDEGGGGGSSEEPGEESDVCVLDRPSVSRWADGRPSVSTIGPQPTTPESANTWSPVHTPDAFRVGLRDS